MSYAARIQQAGFTLEAVDGNLYIEPFSKLTDRQLAFIRRHKSEIIQELTAAANEDGDRLAMRRHPPWPRFDDSGRTGPVVECWTPAGGRVLIRARDLEHAEWLQRMNPPPESGTKSNGEGR